jgi:choice-of-anchor A domain-containing protein
MSKKFLTISLLGVAAASAHAQSLGIAANFNAFVLGNAYTSGGESDGSVAVGGNWTGIGGGIGQYGVSNHNVVAPTIGSATNIGIYVGGNLSLNGSVNNSRNVYFGGTRTGTLNNAGGFSNTAIASNITGQAKLLDGIDNSISLLGASQGNSIVANNDQNNPFKILNHGGNQVSIQNQNINVDLNSNNLTSTMVGNEKVFVFNIDASVLSNSNALIDWKNVGSNDTVLVNVTGTNGFDATNNLNYVNWGWKIQTDSNYNHVLYSFGKAPEVTDRTDSFNGSILAPYSTFVQAGSHNVQGNLIADTFISPGGELHFDSGMPYAGYVPQAVPEPMTMISLALGAISLVCKRKRS